MNKRQFGSDRVVFYSREDLGIGIHLNNADKILKIKTKNEYNDINDILELYNIKKFIDHELYLIKWSQTDIENFKSIVSEYGSIVGKFISTVNDDNFVSFYNQLLYDYIDSFWELINNQNGFKQISEGNIVNILKEYPDDITKLLRFKKIVNHYNEALKDFLISYRLSAEILLTIYEVKDIFNSKSKMHLPLALTLKDKESIISKYIDNKDANLNYLRLIPNAKKSSKFNISDKTRLKARRKEKKETDRIFNEGANSTLIKYGVSISYPENQTKIKDGYFKDSVAHYSYSLDYINQNNDLHHLFLNFKILFEYIDDQNRIDLVSRISQMGVMERVIGIQSKNEYLCGITFRMSEMASIAQIVSYSEVINGLGHSLDNILNYIFTTVFRDKYNFADNARLSMPPVTLSYFEKVRLLAPEFEAVLKQYKLFVEDGKIDFELLQISSHTSSLRNIPSLNPKKYIYLNEDNDEIRICSNILFSDQTTLSYVDPFKGRHYKNFFDLIANEEVNFKEYENHQTPQINYLIEREFLFIDDNNIIQFKDFKKSAILKDLFENEVGSFWHYSYDFQEVANQMENCNMVYFENSLFSKPEISYFNYYLNKSEYTNGLDLRNSYLHDTQANPDEKQIHETAYFIYLKLLVLVLLKIEDDLLISHHIKN